jgi:hypothetical protein
MKKNSSQSEARTVFRICAEKYRPASAYCQGKLSGFGIHADSIAGNASG